MVDVVGVVGTEGVTLGKEVTLGTKLVVQLYYQLICLGVLATLLQEIVCKELIEEAFMSQLPVFLPCLCQLLIVLTLIGRVVS